MLFLVFAIVVAVSCSAITIRTLVGYSDFSFLTKSLVTFLVTVGWFAPVIAISLRKYYDNFPYMITVSHTLYLLFGLAFILFVALLSKDILWYVLYYTKKFKSIPSPKDIYWLNRTNFMALILSLLVFSYAVYEGARKPRIKELNLYTDKITNELTIALVTDLHIGQVTKIEEVEDIVKRINELEVDVVLFAGDFVDDKVHTIGHKFDILKNIEAKYGVYFSLGNHEFYNGMNDWIRKLSGHGEKFKLLTNESVKIKDKNTFILGIPDTRIFRNYSSFAPNLDKAMNGVKGEYSILMSHAPDVAKALPEGMFDLQVSGHTHGGQIFPFHILAKMENKYLAGLYDVNGTNVYVSRGAGHWGPPMRFLAPSEITLIRVKGNEQENSNN